MSEKPSVPQEEFTAQDTPSTPEVQGGGLPSHELNITSFVAVIEDFSLVSSMKEQLVGIKS